MIDRKRISKFAAKSSLRADVWSTASGRTAGHRTAEPAARETDKKNVRPNSLLAECPCYTGVRRYVAYVDRADVILPPQDQFGTAADTAAGCQSRGGKNPTATTGL